MLKNIIQFYLTIGIPLFYVFILMIIGNSQNTLPADLVYIYVGLVLSVAGLVLWFLSYFHLGKSFGVLPKKQKKVKRGVYNYVPHPMYVGISTTFLGLSLCMRSAAGLLATVMFLIPLLIVRAYFEEKKLL